MKVKKQSVIDKAIVKVPGFPQFLLRLKQKMSISGLSQSTVDSYSTHLGQISLYFNRSPPDLTIEEIEEYLYFVQQKYKSFSDSYFKFTVYSLRFVFRMTGQDDKRIKLPILKHERKLPVVLSKEEIVKLINGPGLLKHRILLSLLYGCGLRCFEARNLMVADLDLQRGVLHVRQGKGRKDRYVPLGKFLIRELTYYIKSFKIKSWLFNGKPVGRTGGDFDSRYSKEGVQFVVRSASKNAGILKRVNVHTLRHTFATHLLEDGLDIISIKELLGHSRIETTLVYLHVARVSRRDNFSPLDNLAGIQLLNGIQCQISFEDTVY